MIKNEVIIKDNLLDDAHLIQLDELINIDWMLKSIENTFKALSIDTKIINKFYSIILRNIFS